MTRAGAATPVGAAIAARAASADLGEFGTGSTVVRPRRAKSLLRVVERFGNLGGTETAAAVRRTSTSTTAS